MAQKTVIQLTDDLDGTRINGSGQTVEFALDGVNYQIDLSEKNAGRLRDVLAPYVAAARRGRSGSARGSRSSASTGTTHDAQGIRDWARRNGHEVSERGRISASILAAYEAATGES
jgi:Lsr2